MKRNINQTPFYGNLKKYNKLDKYGKNDINAYLTTGVAVILFPMFLWTAVSPVSFFTFLTPLLIASVAFDIFCGYKQHKTALVASICVKAGIALFDTVCAPFIAVKNIIKSNKKSEQIVEKDKPTEKIETTSQDNNYNCKQIIEYKKKEIVSYDQFNNNNISLIKKIKECKFANTTTQNKNDKSNESESKATTNSDERSI